MIDLNKNDEHLSPWDPQRWMVFDVESYQDGRIFSAMDAAKCACKEPCVKSVRPGRTFGWTSIVSAVISSSQERSPEGQLAMCDIHVQG